MTKKTYPIADGVFTFLILFGVFALNLLLQT